MCEREYYFKSHDLMIRLPVQQVILFSKQPLNEIKGLNTPIIGHLIAVYYVCACGRRGRELSLTKLKQSQSL
jgi:hypothetical protein